MTVIWLHERMTARKIETDKETASERSAAISCALRYLTEEAEDLGERRLAHLMRMAALETKPVGYGGKSVKGEDANDRDRDSAISGIRDCLDALKREASEAGDDVMSTVIGWAHQDANR